ncbi:MAG: methyl-accepting chemotaxis protein [Rubrivivax sp.]|jgi:hypothetical protein|nr:methyl-accepting chemotaxis protein [Rubrivivax sp.]
MAHPHHIIEASHRIGQIAAQKIAQIQRINRATSYLALNALIEASRAGAAGDGFGVVAREVKQVSGQINQLSRELSADLSAQIKHLMSLGDLVLARLQEQQGRRLADLSLNMIDIIDRNLYERSCDVRWWATDGAVVDALQDTSPQTSRHASNRLGVILDSYTVYLDLWVIDAQGRVVSTGRPDRYHRAPGANVRGQPWFDRAMHTRDGQSFVATDIETNPWLDESQVATYSTAIRRDGAVNGEVLGVLAIFFDWQTQSKAVIDAVKFDEDEKPRARALLLDARHRVIASSDGEGILEETLELKRRGKTLGSITQEDGTLIGFARTPGYETYKGLGWYGVIVLKPGASPGSDSMDASESEKNTEDPMMMLDAPQQP